MSIDEPITIKAHNPAWRLLFEQERQHLRQALGGAVVELAHVGSTAVPGLVAKPIIDILAGLPARELAEEQHAALTALGYEYLDEAGIPGRLFFRKRGQHAFNLSAVVHGEQLWTNNLLLRDYLRAHPEDVERYERKKRDIIAAGATRLLAYSEQKGPFMAELLERARKWRAAAGS